MPRRAVLPSWQRGTSRATITRVRRQEQGQQALAARSVYLPLEEFEAKARCKVRILHKVNTRLADTKLWQHGYLSHFIRDYLSNPVSREFEQIPIAA